MSLGSWLAVSFSIYLAALRHNVSKGNNLTGGGVRELSADFSTHYFIRVTTVFIPYY
jgi:hypothetical protein